jgi:hypothetical protein
MDPARARIEQMDYERRFLQEQHDAALLTGPIYTHYQNQAPPVSPRSALEGLVDLPPPPRRDANGRIVARIPDEAASALSRPALAERAEPAPDIGALARLVAALQQQMSSIDASLTAMAAEIAALKRQ